MNYMLIKTDEILRFERMIIKTSSQDGGIGSYTLPPRITKEGQQQI